MKVPKGRRTLVVTDDGEPERGVDVEVIGIEEKCVVPRVNSAEGEESDWKVSTQSMQLTRCKCTHTVDQEIFTVNFFTSCVGGEN